MLLRLSAGIVYEEHLLKITHASLAKICRLGGSRGAERGKRSRGQPAGGALLHHLVHAEAAAAGDVDRRELLIAHLPRR